jgi:hypothetical protein
MEAVGDSGAHGFFFESHRAVALWLFCFSSEEARGFRKENFIHGHFGKGKKLIEWSLLGQENVRRRGGDEKILWGRKRF